MAQKLGISAQYLMHALAQGTKNSQIIKQTKQRVSRRQCSKCGVKIPEGRPGRACKECQKEVIQ